MDKFLKNGRGLLLAYDQGFEHGPADFDAKNVDPAYIIDIARQSGVFTGIILQKGVAERYYVPENRKQRTENSNLPPLIIKLNAKTAFHQGEEPFAPLVCTVGEAVELGASAVGYTVYVGSEYEYKMTRTLGDIVRECNQRRIPTIAWMYLRGKHISDPHDRQKLAYAARLGLELGADAVKLQFILSSRHSERSEESRRDSSSPSERNISPSAKLYVPSAPQNDADLADLRWIVQNAGKCKVFISGGSKIPDDLVLQLTKVVKAAGAAGLAIGRNIWQRDNPVEFSQEIAQILYES